MFHNNMLRITRWRDRALLAYPNFILFFYAKIHISDHPAGLVTLIATAKGSIWGVSLSVASLCEELMTDWLHLGFECVVNKTACWVVNGFCGYGFLYFFLRLLNGFLKMVELCCLQKVMFHFCSVLSPIHFTA